MKKIITILALSFLLVFMVSCDSRKFDAKTETFTDASVVDEYINKAKEEGFKYYTFIDLRTGRGSFGDYDGDKAFYSGRISYFDSVSWANGSDKGKERIKTYLKNRKINKDYPIILIDYDGKWINDCSSYINSLGYTNVKSFMYGYFGDNGYIALIGKDNFESGEFNDCGCE